MMHAELDGLVCSGALRGKQHTYAMLQHFVWCSRLRVADAKAGLAMIRRHLVCTILDGKTE